ncbi:septum site-determining protein MinC, partial [Enterobacter asburiae]|nr:septum site-determining protein MinC [Enterobacter asburiae]
MSNTPIELKGSSFTLSVVHLHDAKPEVIRQALEDKIAQAPAFLKHAPVVVNVAGLDAPVNWTLLQQAVSATGLRIVGVSGCKDPELKAEIDRAGLPILTEGKEKAPRPAPAPAVAPPP